MADIPAESARIASLYRYPVKGLSGEKLPAVDLVPGATFPMDRAFALENGPVRLRPGSTHLAAQDQVSLPDAQCVARGPHHTL
jgi:uncharacterized protein YcbX